ncbi:MAG TPA: calcium-binding protein [Thermoleophilaceae bacterium]
MRGAVAAAALALLVPAAAQAGTVSVYVPPCAPEQSKYGACYPDEARFTAADGELNKVTITRATEPPSFQPQVTIKDGGAPVKAGGGCTQVDDHTATCTGYNVVAIVAAGDGDDAVSGPASVDGGAGDDVLTGGSVEQGGAGDDTLVGSDTGAQLDGGPGRDRINGGPGADTITDAANAGEQDVVDGGDGGDVMSYAGRKAAVTVSLQQPLAGEDQLSAIESLRGGDGNDWLTGDAGPNTLDGGRGRDLLVGGDGDDTLAGGEDADALEGGAGDDKLDPGEDKARNKVGCGSGEDHADPRPNTLIAPDCEVIGIDDFDLGGVVRLHLPLASRRAALLTLDPLGCIDLPCTVRMTVTAKHRVIGQVRAVQRTKRRKLPDVIPLRLSSAGARMVKRSGPLDAGIQITVTDGGDRTTSSFRIALGY